MESIDELRKMDDDELVALGNGQYGRDYRHGRIADEIEREIAERYMELPVDSDGVPIRVGDKLILDNGYHPPMEVEVQPLTTYQPSCYRHVKPRTIEDVLTELVEFATNGTNMPDYEEAIAKYADELREMEVE